MALCQEKYEVMHIIWISQFSSTTLHPYETDVEF